MNTCNMIVIIHESFVVAVVFGKMNKSLHYLTHSPKPGSPVHLSIIGQ